MVVVVGGGCLCMQAVGGGWRVPQESEEETEEQFRREGSRERMKQGRLNGENAKCISFGMACHPSLSTLTVQFIKL